MRIQRKLLSRLRVLFSRRTLLVLVRAAVILSMSFAAAFGFLAAMRNPGLHYNPHSFAVGADASLDMLTFAAGKTGEQKWCSFSVAYAQQLPFKSASFDVITSLNFLHLFSLDTQRLMIAEMKRVLRPGGILVLEFDNALNGLGLGLLKRWSGRERGSLPAEIRQVIGSGCAIEQVSGAVLPVVWRMFCRYPRVFRPFEAITRWPMFNRLGHRIYYKLRKQLP